MFMSPHCLPVNQIKLKRQTGSTNAEHISIKAKSKWRLTRACSLWIERRLAAEKIRTIWTSKGKRWKNRARLSVEEKKKEKERILKSLSSAYPAESTLLAAASTNHKRLFFTHHKNDTKLRNVILMLCYFLPVSKINVTKHCAALTLVAILSTKHKPDLLCSDLFKESKSFLWFTFLLRLTLHPFKANKVRVSWFQLSCWPGTYFVRGWGTMIVGDINNRVICMLYHQKPSGWSRFIYSEKKSKKKAT